MHTLDSISLEDAEQLPELFIENLALIFEHDATEIQEYLLKFHSPEQQNARDNLVTIRQKLFDSLCLIFPSLQDRDMYNRRKIERLALDVYTLGNSLVNKLEDQRVTTHVLRPMNAASRADESLTADGAYNELFDTCLQLRRSVVQLTSTVEKLSLDIKDLEARLEAHVFPTHPVAPVPNVPHPADAPPVNTPPAATPPDHVDQSDTEDDDDELTSAANDEPPTNNDEQPQTDREQAAGNSVALADNTITSQEGGAFTLPRNQRQRIRRGHANTTSRREPVSGTSTTTLSIQGVDHHSGLRSTYVGRLADTVTVDSMRRHLREIGIEEVSDVIDLRCRTTGQSSYCIVVDSEVAEEALYNAANWPLGTKVRPYSKKNSQPRQPQRNNPITDTNRAGGRCRNSPQSQSRSTSPQVQVARAPCSTATTPPNRPIPTQPSPSPITAPWGMIQNPVMYRNQPPPGLQVAGQQCLFPAFYQHLNPMMGLARGFNL